MYFFSIRSALFFFISVIYALWVAESIYGALSEDYLLEGLKDVYSGIRTVNGNFIQKTYIKDLEKKDTFEGVFFLKKPDKMKWRYIKGSSDEVYLNGKEIIVYQPKESQVFVSSTDRYGLSNSPLRILMNLSDIEKDFIVKGEGRELFLKPKRTDAIVEFILLELSGESFPVRKITFVDRYSNKTEIELENLKVNKELSTLLFEFKPPAGTVIIRQ